MRAMKWVAIFLLVLITATSAGNWFAAHRHMHAVLSDDPRNRGIEAWAYLHWLADPTTIVIDIRSVQMDKTPTDVTRVLVQFAERMRDKRFESVILSHQGMPKFMLEGDYFRQLGDEYDVQNPVYTIRTMPENVYELDGTPAFPQWTGGLIGVLGRQMEDNLEFHRRWYIDAEFADHQDR